jgi:hypothetical protein
MTPYDFIWQAAAILALGALGVWVCEAVAKGESDRHFPAQLKRARHLYLAFPILSVLPWANVYVATHLSIQWNMPEWLQLHWAAVSWGIVSATLAYVFGFCSAVAWASEKWGRRLPAVFSVAVLLAIQFYAAWSSRPNLPALDDWTTPDGIVLQTSDYTCVPASGATIASILGIHATEKQLAVLFHTTRDGTFPASALSGMRQLGIEGRKVSAVGGDIRAVHPPAMLFFVNDTHAVVFAGITSDGLVEIWNPSQGKTFFSENALNRVWTGHALEFHRAGK